MLRSCLRATCCADLSATPPLGPAPPSARIPPPTEACAALPTRKLAKPAALADLDEPADVYQWTSSGGLVLRMRLPRRIGKPKGEWYIDEDPRVPGSGEPAKSRVDDTAYAA